MDSALHGDPQASPSDLPVQAHMGLAAFIVHPTSTGVLRLGFAFGPSRRNIDPAGTLASADCSAASRGLSTTTVPHHPANTPSVTGHPGTPAEPSEGKTNNLHRTPTAFTERPLDDIGLRLVGADSPGPPRLIRAAHQTRPGPVRHVFLGSRLRTPASSPPSLTTEQLPSACGWCHQPPQGTCTPELLVMPRTLPACGTTALGSCLG